MSVRSAKPFATEADLCARFLEAVAKGKGWTPYAETAGWDILLVRDADGLQIGIEAKLKLGAHVMLQAIEEGRSCWRQEGPDHRAVLVPEGQRGFYDKIADYIGLTIVTVRPALRGVYQVPFYPALPLLNDPHGESIRGDWHEMMPTKRHALPAYVPDVAAGSPAPLQLTEWKIAAIKIAVTLELRGFVTRDDFKAHRIDHRRWTARDGWLRPSSLGWVAGPMPDFKAQHPTVYAQIAAEAEKWMPKTLLSGAPA